MMVLELEGVTKKYGSRCALEHFSMIFEEGLYGLLGVNGSGKSTLFRLITESISRDEGRIMLNGEDIRKKGSAFRKLLGYMPQDQGYYEHMSIVTFLHYIAEMKGIHKKYAAHSIDKLLNELNLIDRKHDKMKTLSGGMRQRVMLAQALLGEPQILLLDEPTAGLDPEERIRIRNYITSVSTGRIVILATHIVSDVDSIADKVVILKDGKIAIQGTQDELIMPLDGKVMEFDRKQEDIRDHQRGIADISGKYQVVNIMRHKGGEIVRIVGDGFPCEGYRPVQRITLEDAFVYYNLVSGGETGCGSLKEF